MLDEIKKMFNLKEISELEFKKMYGFTFVFETKIIHTNNLLASSEIRPVGIIYEENDEFYFAPLDEVDDINGIVEEFVESSMLK